MSTLDADDISRVELLFLTDGSAHSLEDAERLMDSRRLTLRPTDGAARTADGQAAILTAVVTAVRSFGTVHVNLPADVQVLGGTHRGSRLSDALRDEGAQIAPRAPADDAIVIVIGNEQEVRRSGSTGLVLHAAWDGWSAIVSTEPCPAGKVGNVLAAITAAALAVAEAFEYARQLDGSDAGYRDMRLDLLGPACTAAPDLRYAPAAWWLVGLGHLGQAYAWVISLLPYDQPGLVAVTLQDTDHSSPANFSTSVLTPCGSCGVAKTRLVSARMEMAGIRTRIIERSLDARPMPRPAPVMNAVRPIRTVALTVRPARSPPESRRVRFWWSSRGARRSSEAIRSHR